MNKISYALGVSLGRSLKQSGVEKVALERLFKGIEDVMTSKEAELSPEEVQQVLGEYFQDLQAKQGAKDVEKGKIFLAENGKRDDVTTTESGLQYEVMTTGSGAKPKSTDTVKVHYHGMLLDGTVFDSSVQRGTPAEFGVTQVIAGWVEALQLMSVGSKWKLYIPSELAYGTQGAGQMIGPNATLIFEVELLDIL